MVKKNSDSEEEEEIEEVSEDDSKAKEKKDSERSERQDAVRGKEQKITDLPGIGPAAAAKLESAGIYDLMSLAVMSPTVLADAAGVGPAVARKAIQAARNLLELGLISLGYKSNFSFSILTILHQNFLLF